ncbi:hypothetical protein MRX96_010579 [Rhipicephalus microplus]
MHRAKSTSPWHREADIFVYLMESDVLWSLFTTAGVTAAKISVLVLRNFEHYMDPCRAYREILPCFQRAHAKETVLEVCFLELD